MTSYQKIVMPLSFFKFMPKLQPSESQIPNAWSRKLILINNNLLSYKTWIVN